MSLTLLLFIAGYIHSAFSKPNIVFILADDLGWNDVGFHGSNQIPTPNIDALAYTGIILNNYYVTPVCTPSRSALMTGKYPIHTGMQHEVIYGDQPWGLPLQDNILPQYLRKRGYATQMVGKWHLGHFESVYLPQNRGFDSHYGYWVGHQDYYDHTSQENTGYWGFDMRRNMNLTWDDFGKYTTDLFTNQSVQIIQEHDTNRPLFLYIAHLATHSANPYEPLQAPYEEVQKYKYIGDLNRRIFAGMLSKLDESVGQVVSALSTKGILNNTIIIFSTDNGGPAAGFNSNAASNWPLRGVKDTLWEGGVRGVGLVWNPSLLTPRISNDMMHITDWLPTLLSAVSEEASMKDIDGMDLWPTLSQSKVSPRHEFVINIDTKRKFAGLRSGNWKYIEGSTWNHTWDGWYGPSGRATEYQYNYSAVYNSFAGKSIQKLHPLPNEEQVHELRQQLSITCEISSGNNSAEGGVSDTYLFNINSDPCETTNLANIRIDKVKEMEEMMLKYKAGVVPPRNKPADPRSNPKYWGYAWVNWMDYTWSENT